MDWWIDGRIDKHDEVFGIISQILYCSILFFSLQRFKVLFLLRSSLIVFCVVVVRIDFSVMIFDARTMNATNSHKRHPFIGLFNSTQVTIYMAKDFHRSCHKSGSHTPPSYYHVREFAAKKVWARQAFLTAHLLYPVSFHSPVFHIHLFIIPTPPYKTQLLVHVAFNGDIATVFI